MTHRQVPFPGGERNEDLMYAFKVLKLKSRAKCFLCGVRLDWHTATVDHWIPVIRGGKNRFKNFRLMCAPCNKWKGHRLPQEVMDALPGYLERRKQGVTP